MEQVAQERRALRRSALDHGRDSGPALGHFVAACLFRPPPSHPISLGANRKHERFGLMVDFEAQRPLVLVMRRVRILRAAQHLGRGRRRRHEARQHPISTPPLYLSFASRREAGEVEDASQPESPEGQ